MNLLLKEVYSLPLRNLAYGYGEVEDIEKALEEILERAAEDDREELQESLEKAFEEVADLPESPERDGLFDEFVRLAEAYGFTVTEVDGDEGGGPGQGRGRGDD